MFRALARVMAMWDCCDDHCRCKGCPLSADLLLHMSEKGIELIAQGAVELIARCVYLSGHGFGGSPQM